MSRDFRVISSLYYDDYDVVTRRVYTDVDVLPRYRYTDDYVVTPRPTYRRVYTPIVTPTPRIVTERVRVRTASPIRRVRSISPRRVYYDTGYSGLYYDY